MGGLSFSIVLVLIEFGVRVALGGVILIRRRFDPMAETALAERGGHGEPASLTNVVH